MKVCTKCKVEKEFSEFNKDKKRKDGLFCYCKVCVKKCQKNYYIDNKEYRKENQKKYYLDNKNIIKEKKKLYYLNNKKYVKKNNKQYNLKNKENRNKKEKHKKLIDPLFKLKCNISNLIYMSLINQGYKKTSKTYDILGCSFEEFKTYLENQFTEGMTWENQGKWHLDHIYPVSRATDEYHLIKLNHYTNFQPLWAIDNIKKGNKIINNSQLL